MRKYRVAIAGCGPRGKDHAKAFLANAERFDLVAVSDPLPDRQAEIKPLLPKSVRCYGQTEKMLAEERPEVFCFATQPNVRLELVEMGIRYGAKAIAFEKPMANNLAEAKRIRDVCAEAKVLQIQSHQHKYGEHWRKVKELVDSGEIGTVHTIHATAKGWYLHYATHLLDYTMWLNGGHRGVWVTGHAHGRGKLMDNHPSPDYVQGLIGFENGVRGILECGTLAPHLPGDNSFWMDAGAIVYGSEGYAQVVTGSGWQAVTRSSRGLITGKGSFNPDHDQPLYIRDLADWLDDSRRVHPCNGEISYHGFELTVGILQSALERRKITVPVEAASEPIMDRMRRELPES